MISIVGRALVAALCLASIVTADSYRFYVDHITSNVPREWNNTGDNLGAVINMVTDGQNISSPVWSGVNGTVPGTSLALTNLTQDITLTGREPNLTVVMSIFNVGDGDPQEVALEITSFVIDLIKGNLVVEIIDSILGGIIDLFTTAYKCEGPVALDAPVYSQQQLSNMAVNQPVCETKDYQYAVGSGCETWIPVAGKNSSYTVRYCLQRLTASAQNGAQRHYNGFNYGASILVITLFSLFFSLH